MQRRKIHTTIYTVLVVVALLTIMTWQFISRRMHARFRPIAERCKNWRRNHKTNSDTDSLDGMGREKMEGSRGLTQRPVPEVVIVDDDDDDHIFATSTNDEETCRERVLSVLEDICPSHMDMLAKEHAYDAQLVIAAIMDRQEKGEEYPRRSNPLKRKWESDGDYDTDAMAKYKGAATLQAKINDPLYAPTMSSRGYKNFAVQLISQDFAKAPKLTIKRLLSDNGSVLRTYMAMDDARRAGNGAEQRMWTEKKIPTPALPELAPGNITALPRNDFTPEEVAALDEFVAARASRDKKDAVFAEEIKELANLEQAKSRGEMRECGCCFDDVPLNRMVHCAGEATHSFCRKCLKQQAETTVGYHKYELTCMAMEGCDAGFSTATREAFLDKKLKMALDRIEQQAMLDMAGLEDLETCPFCPYAMGYPPMEENKEFRCENPSCLRVSCRLCRNSTHIPKSCAEVAQDEAHDVRHTIEEAMSEAMIRKCNNCKNAFIKQDGCNKICCTRCRTFQCYICRQTVADYSHFNDVSRGGMPGRCPLFDATEERHQHEVQRAEEEMRKKVTQERPDLIGDGLNVKVSSRVKEDEQKRKEREAARAAARRGPRYGHAAAAAGLAPEIIRRHNPDPPNVRPRPEDARGARLAPWAGPRQPPAVVNVPPVQKPASNPSPAAVLPLQSQQHRQHQADELRAWEVELDRHRWNLLQQLNLRRNLAVHGRHHLPQAAQPQAAHPPAAWPAGNQYGMALHEYYNPLNPHFPQLGALSGPVRPPGQPVNVQLQSPAGPPAMPPRFPGWAQNVLQAQHPQQAQQRQQPQQPQQPQRTQGLPGSWQQATAWAGDYKPGQLSSFGRR